VVVAPATGDATARIQAAIAYVAALPPDASGIRGAVLLQKGRYPIASHLKITASGVVLRGQGSGEDGTVIVATGTDRRTLVQVAGRNDPHDGPAHRIKDSYVPVGATTVHLDNADALHVGDPVVIRRPSTAEWIARIGMYQFPGRPGGDFRFTWVPGKMDIAWHRVITKLDGDAVTLDAPLTTALDASVGGGTLALYTWPGRIAQVGIENLRCESDYDRAHPQDEQHAWMAVSMDSVRDAWVRNVDAVHFASSAVSLWETCSRVTVQDCRSLDPVSEIGGYRRHTFYTAGQQTLFLRCHAEHGRRDFAVGYLAGGPSAFVHCDASDCHDFSGPIESWASGALFDNVNTDGSIKLDNREIWDQGVGWAAANCMLWNCTAPVIVSREPPGAHNWVMGTWGMHVGDGHWGSVNEFEKPDSLYLQQLQERVGPSAVEATRPREIPSDTVGVKTIEQLAPDLLQAAAHPPSAPAQPFALESGWLTISNNLLIGDRVNQTWWRGHIIPSRAGQYGPHITRFVPGRIGRGFTEDLPALADEMAATGKPLLVHHWGLWYDERRQDHEMVRRLDADVWPPFYEQAWARSGTGRAWDGLSKYDLTRYNPWYFSRLHQFADLAQQHGLVLENLMYFQHNIIEAGAHWVDTPWRPANALQNLGFPEPPPFKDRKRIFMADAFYDVTIPARREFHRAFIRESLDNLADQPNVIHALGEEFTGPLPFVQFWLDTIAEWEHDTGKHPLIALSCTKDVQDAILADPERAKLVSIIEMKYWWPTADGKLFDPKGGQSLAPRQQLREWKGSKTRSEPGTAQQVRDYRRRFPDKAILCAYEKTDGWAILSAGGSLPAIPPTTDARLLAALPKMHPFEPATALADNQWALADPGLSYLVYSMSNSTIRLDFAADSNTFTVSWIDPATGRVTDGQTVTGGGVREFRSPIGDRSVLLLTRQ
jgi:hypothetical protein